MILSRPVSAAELPAAPVEIVAGERERALLAAENALVSVDSLAASVELSRAPGGALVVEGRVIADIVQTCVVSLEPVPAHIDETFSVRFVHAAPRAAAAANEIVVDPAAPDPPEVLSGPNIDVGALVEEHFLLAIDTYPRAPGASLPAAADGGSGGEASSPFSALAALARKSGDGDKG